MDKKKCISLNITLKNDDMDDIVGFIAKSKHCIVVQTDIMFGHIFQAVQCGLSFDFPLSSDMSGNFTKHVDCNRL